MDKLFWIDGINKRSYRGFFSDINNTNYGKPYIWEASPYRLFLWIIHSLLHDYPIVVLDGDFTEREVNQYGFSLETLNEKIPFQRKNILSFDQFIECINKTSKWSITLLTSGTTGIPKKISHHFASISKGVKISKDHRNDVWGFAYNPTHMAGIQVFFQAFLNQNTLINIFGKSSNIIQKCIYNYQISHLSATPTFYRLFLNDKTVFYNIKQVSSGGEKFSENLRERLQKSFPNARIRNIYASTEAGSLFASEGEYFSIPKQYEGKVRILDGEIIIHGSLIGNSSSLSLHKGWYHSGDMVEIIKNRPRSTFRFLRRKNEMINVGGYKINPGEVEEALLKNPKIKAARVYGKANSVLGNILCADIVSKDISEKEIRQGLDLQNLKIPRIFRFVDHIEVTRTGKLQR